jgi:hypothetical protein
MCRIPYTDRIHGRYVFRRRVHFRNLISKPLAVALRTADPKAARRRAALLAARFMLVKTDVDMLLEHGRPLTGAEIEAIFRQTLEEELSFYVNSAYENAPWSSSVQDVAASEGEAYRILRLPDRHAGMTEQDRARLSAKGMSSDISEIEAYIQQIREKLTDQHIAERLAAIGAPAHANNIPVARGHMIRAGAAACARVTRVFDDEALDAADPVRALMADLGEPSAEIMALLSRRRPSTSASPTPALTNAFPATGSDSPFIIYDDRRFSDGIDDIILELKQEKTWKGDCRQQRRIMQTFAWITGDKPRGAYTHLDVNAFKRGLMRLSTKFRFGSFEAGAMSRPFAEVAANLLPVPKGEERHAKTVNRDLSTMSTVSKHLAKTVWKAKASNGLILDFADLTVTVKSTGDDPRPPWTKEHMELLFSSPLYTGGGGVLRRLDSEGQIPIVWHDAAYWVPLLCYYHHTCREETCGLRVDEVLIDHEVPHFEIKDNDVRGRDGELAGEKRLARRRKLPIHEELIRLGFLDYVRAIRAEKQVALFPELYLFNGKRGGAQFYARTWTHLVDWIGARLPLPRNPAGKGPDMHSIRSLGSSFYEVDGVNEIIRADVMGHARTTVNGRSYSKRLATEGLTVLLGEHKMFMKRYVPMITKHLDPGPIRLLPIDKRSRVGSSLSRKTRDDAGISKANPID